jgi:hypothetical protein
MTVLGDYLAQHDRIAKEARLKRQATADLAKEDAKRAFRRSSDWLKAIDALATVLGKMTYTANASLQAEVVLHAIYLGEIPGVGIIYGGDA